MFGLKLSVRGHQHVFQLEIPELQAFHGKIELGPEIIIMALACFSLHNSSKGTFLFTDPLFIINSLYIRKIKLIVCENVGTFHE